MWQEGGPVSPFMWCIVLIPPGVSIIALCFSLVAQHYKIRRIHKEIDSKITFVREKLQQEKEQCKQVKFELQKVQREKRDLTWDLQKKIDVQQAALDKRTEVCEILQKNSEAINQQIGVLKKEVDKDRLQIDSDENKEAIANYIVDEFIERHM